jgi:putative ABC transport system permease protein
LAFTGVVATIAGVALGIVPAFRSTGLALVPALEQNAESRSAISGTFERRFRIGDSFVVGQVALSVLVLVVSTLLVRTLVNLKSIDPGFDTGQVLDARVNSCLYRNLRLAVV